MYPSPKYYLYATGGVHGFGKHPGAAAVFGLHRSLSTPSAPTPPTLPTALTPWQTFTFETNDILITDMNFEMLFQFGSEAAANLGEVTVEIVSITIYQKTVN